MARRRRISSALHNFLSTYASRYSDYDGYWLFGMVIDHLDAVEIDLLHAAEESEESSPDGLLTRLAVEKFADQIKKAGLSISCLREAWLYITKPPVVTHGAVNGYLCAGHEVQFAARAVSDLGKTYEAAITAFVAPHNPLAERQSG